ncbi:hypothetical protein H4R35_006231 [Dimargaris xerosporica]|nr:hypothetical protein H4R35_006231 [Dimargaris xerosporica]
MTERYQKLHQWYIIPRLIPPFTERLTLQIHFNGHRATCGNHIDCADMTTEPSIAFDSVGLDEEAPCMGSKLEFRHWVITGIPGSDVSEGEVVSEYIAPPSRPESWGSRRVAFLLYREPNSPCYPPLGPYDEFCMSRYATQSGLTLVAADSCII